MASRNSTIIPPFPDHIDRNYFGAWLSGFTDGEGCFQAALREYKNKKRKGKWYTSCVFTISLRSDDETIVRNIHSYLGVGTVAYRPPAKNQEIRKGKSQYRYEVCNVSDIVNYIIHQFEKYPLMSKKRRDYEIWKQACILAHSVGKQKRRYIGGKRGILPIWSKGNIEIFKSLCDDLVNIRKFTDKQIESVEPRQYTIVENQTGFMFSD